MAQRSLHRAMADRLAEAGVRRAFGVPGGGSNLDLIEALRSAGIGFVLARTELGAAFMACAGAELTGVPGVVLVGNGPGLTSVVNGVAHAHLDRVPLLVISDRFTDAEAAATGHQILPQRRLLQPVVRFGATVRADDAPATLERALAAAVAAPRGPVHLDMPRDVAGEAAPGVAARCAEPVATPAALAGTAAWLRDARRPVVLAGLEVGGQVDAGALASLATRLRAPVLTTYKAKGALDEAHPMWAGILTGGELERPLLAAADAVLTVGLDPVELLSRPWPYAAAVQALRTAPGDDPYPPGAATVVTGDVGAAVRALAGASGRSEWTAEEVARHRDGWLGRLRISGAGGLRGWQVVEAVQAQAPEDTIVAVDAGAHMFPATSFWRSRAPGRFLISNGLATMGFAVPSAIGAALARPGSPVIALTGDGGMAYHAAELETAQRAGARVIVVVFNDASLSLIRIKHEANGHARAPLDLGDVRFDRWAAALGAHGTRVETAHELADAVRGALARPTSTVVDVRLDGAEYAETLAVVRG